MSERNIKAIDRIILDSSNAKSTEEYLNELSNAIILNGKSDYSKLFDRELKQADKRFISLCFLRIYSINSIIVTHTSVKHAILKLIKEATPEVYIYLKIDDRTENYKVESHLGSYISTFEKKIEENVAKDFDLSSVNNFRNNLLSTLNHKLYKSMLDEFTDAGVINKSLDKLFSALTDYVDGSQIDKYKNYNILIGFLDNVIESAQEIGTKYSLNYWYAPFSKIKDSVIQDFINNPNSKPANLQVLKTEKKYPILNGVNHKLQLKIENLSTGFANDTIMCISDATHIELKNNQIFFRPNKNVLLCDFRISRNKRFR